MTDAKHLRYANSIVHFHEIDTSLAFMAKSENTDGQ